MQKAARIFINTKTGRGHDVFRSIFQQGPLSYKHQQHFCQQAPNLIGRGATQRNKSTNANNQTSDSTHIAFNRRIKKLQREGAARSHMLYNKNTDKSEEIVNYDYFKTEIANRLIDRLDDIIREDGFPLALDIGSGPGFLHKAICNDDGNMDLDMMMLRENEDNTLQPMGGIGGVRKLVQMDSSPLMLHRDDETNINDSTCATTTAPSPTSCGTYQLVGDEEGPLPFPDGTFDLVISSTALHWVNDLPGLFSEVKRVLKPDGCFMFAMVGGNTTLHELRSSLVLAEMEREGGVSTHVGPFIDVSDLGMLLTNAGFALPTIDVDTIQLSYPNAFVLMEHLQRMGEGNACLNRRELVGKDTFLAAACVYDEMFKLQQADHDDELYGEKQEIDNNGTSDVEASVQVIYAIGWSPHESQQKPKARGSASRKVGEIIVEKSTASDDEHKI